MAKVNPEILIWARKTDPELVGKVTEFGYAPDLDETELEKVGRDPFLISYGYADIKERCVITFEVSAPSRQRANRKAPDICAGLDIPCGTLFDLIDALDFSTGWIPE